MIWSTGRNLSDPITLVGFLLQARAIAWPTTVIVPVTVLLWTCCPCPKNPVLVWAANLVRHWTCVAYGTCCKYGSMPKCLTQAHQFCQCISLVLVGISNVQHKRLHLQGGSHGRNHRAIWEVDGPRLLHWQRKKSIKHGEQFKIGRTHPRWIVAK
jgi:hypothetical protein